MNTCKFNSFQLIIEPLYMFIQFVESTDVGLTVAFVSSCSKVKLTNKQQN